MKYTLPFSKIDQDDLSSVGSVGAKWGDLVRAGMPVQPGFVVTAEAYWEFLDKSGLSDKIHHLLQDLNAGNSKSLEEASVLIRRAVVRSPIPKILESEINDEYRKLVQGKKVPVRVSTSSTSSGGMEERFGSGASFNEVLRQVRQAWAAGFSPVEIASSSAKKINHSKVGMGVVVQLVAEPEVSGVAFSIDPITNDKSKVVVEAIYGAPELLEEGAVTPDHFEFDKSSLAMTYSQVGVQDKQMVRVGEKSKVIAVSKAYMVRQKISDKVAREVAKYVREVEKYYTRPQEIVWEWDGNKIWVKSSRIVTIVAHKVGSGSVISLPRVLKGAPGSDGIASGRAMRVGSNKDLEKMRSGDVIVTSMTTPSLLPAMRRAAAVVTDKGGRTAHAAVAGRELGIPTVVGTVSATKDLQPGQMYTVNGSTGDVHSGVWVAKSVKLPYEAKPQVATGSIPLKTATKVTIDLADPNLADSAAAENIDGAVLRGEVLLKRMDVHPRRVLRDKREKEHVERLTRELTEISRAFGERPVVYTVSNLASDEYRDMKGGSEFEDYEPNPMLGYRGAARCTQEPEVLGLELAAIKKVRNAEGHKNLYLAISCVRTAQELASVKQLVTAAGLHRSASFKLYMLAQVPSNVLQLEDFAKVGIDGVIADVKALATLILGVDSSARRMKESYPEIDASVLWCLEKLAVDGKKLGLTVGASNVEVARDGKLIERLVGWGYSSVSMGYEEVGQAREIVAEAEKKLVKKG